MDNKSYTFQNYGTREYVLASSKEEALKIYKEKHRKDICKIACWVWDKAAQRFVVDRPGATIDPIRLQTIF